MRPSSRGSLLGFFLLTYGLAWVFFVPVAATANPITPLQGVLVTLGAYTPSVVALWLTWRAEGAAGLRGLLDRNLRVQVPARWYVLAATYEVAIRLAAALILRLATGAWPTFGTTSWLVIPFAIAISTPFQAGEELGWRAYALPRLAARVGLGGAGIVLGVIWALWHLPLFFVRGADTYHQSFFVYALGVIAISVAMTWLYARAGSLLPVMLLHAGINNSKDIVPSGVADPSGPFVLRASPVGWITLALMWIAAAYFLATMPKSLPGDLKEADRAGDAVHDPQPALGS